MLLLERRNINKKNQVRFLGSDILDHHVPSSFCPEDTGSMIKCCHVGERVQLEFVSGLSELQRLWRNIKQWNRRDWESISCSVTGFLCHSVVSLLGPCFQKSSIRYLAN